MTARRTGYTLLELLVALPLVALLGVVAVSLLLSVHRQVLVVDGTLGATRELRHGGNVLAAEWRGIRIRDIAAWTDTSFEFDATVGVGVVCSSRTPANSVSVVGADAVELPSASPLSMIWNQPLQSGDQLRVWLPGLSPVDSLRPADVRVSAAAASTDCDSSALTSNGNRNTLRITLTDSLVSSPAVGTPLRIIRRTRYSLYRSSDGDWYLGRRTRGPSGWDVIQPVAGPLLSPRERGVRFTVVDSTGAVLASPVPPAVFTATSARVSALLRAPRRAGRASSVTVVNDSLTVDIAVRTGRGASP